jgi:ABC-type sugar transport system substrate-binding protein
MKRKSTLKYATLVSTVALFGAVFMGVTSSSASTSGSSRLASVSASHVVIGSVVYDENSVPFLATLGKAQQKEAKAIGVTIHVVNGGNDATTQVSEVEQFIAEKVSMILLTPSDPKALVPAVKQANAAGIPVISVNTPIASGMGAKVITYVGDNDYTYGLYEGQLIAKAIHYKGNVAVILGVLGTTPEVSRSAGIDFILKKYSAIHIVTTVDDAWTNSQNLAVTEDLLTKYPKGTLQGVVAEGPEMYVGAKYARSQGRNEIMFVAGDYPTEVEAAIKNGSIYGATDQSPVLEGVNSVVAAKNWLTGKKNLVQRPYDYIPLPVITKANVNQYPSPWTF